MTRALLGHAALPALAPLALVGLYFTPLTVVSCQARGLLALAVTLIAALAAFVCIARAFRAGRGTRAGRWWTLTALILTLPLVLLLGPLG